jgi:hypothetical protein
MFSESARLLPQRIVVELQEGLPENFHHPLGFFSTHEL